MRKLLALAVLFSAPFSLLAYDNKERQEIRVFVFTASNPTGFVDPNHKDLTDSVQDLKKVFSVQKYTLVDDRSGADVSVEVVGRNFTGGEHSAPGAADQYHIATVHVVLSAGNYSTTIDGVNDTGSTIRQWLYAAFNAQKQIDKWIGTNYDKLLSLRKKSQ